MRPPRSIALVADYVEERWPSMDLAAEMLARELRRRGPVDVLRPRYRRRLGRAPLPGRAGRLAANADRFLNRFWDYPRWLAAKAGAADVFHVVDHTYAQLVHVLPAARTGVYLHDLDAFRCVLEPARDPRPRWFRAMARRVLTGLRRAAVVFHSTAAVRDEALRLGLVDPARLVEAPLGPAPEFTAEGDVDSTVTGPYLLHVGSSMPRKRIDLLLDSFARVAARRPDLQLVQVGQPWTPDEGRRLERLGVAARVHKLSGVPRTRLAALYRGARLVVVPSDAEGFGLPVIEALACGAPVLASAIPALREVGADAASYAPPGDVAAWEDAIARALEQPEGPARRERRLGRAADFSWARHAEVIWRAYEALVPA